MKVIFSTPTKVASLPELMRWAGKLPGQATGIMMSCLRKRLPVLVLEDVPRASLERLTAILLPGHDHGWLAFYLYSTSPLYPDGKAVGSNFRVSPRDLPVSAMGEPLDSVMEFSEPVLEAFAEWRCEPLPGRASGWPAPGARPTGHTPPPC